MSAGLLNYLCFPERVDVRIVHILGMLSGLLLEQRSLPKNTLEVLI
jgi:hypothetical protein